MPDTAPVSFDERDTRDGDMEETIASWIDELAEGAANARATEHFQEWLDVQSRFHDYSYKNTMLITAQCPHATRVAGYQTWKEEFDRHVKEGETAIWIWAPIITTRCPECHNSPNYHENIDCDYDETPPEEWDQGVVGFKPVSVFDVSQTEGEPLPSLNREATGGPSDLVPRLLAAADDLELEVEIIPSDDWTYGTAKGIIDQGPFDGNRQTVEVRDRDNEADLARSLIHEFAHGLLHPPKSVDNEEKSKREVEAEAVAYVVGRHFGLDTSGSAFYLASWGSDSPEVVRDRLKRISKTAENIIDTIEDITVDHTSDSSTAATVAGD